LIMGLPRLSAEPHYNAAASCTLAGQAINGQFAPEKSGKKPVDGE
jgi:hypothetical protein